MVAIFLAIGGAISIPWMRRLSSGVEALAAGATALAQREVFERPDIHIRELDEIATAIAGADAILRRRDADLNDLNATLVQRVETALSQRKGALDQLHEARKLESLGQLTGGVAHDFNNLLSPIMGALEMLRIRMGEDAKSVRLIDAALVSSERAKLLVARLLSFSRRQALRPRATDVSALVIDMGDLLRGSLGSPIGLTIDPGVGVDPAHIDPNQLELAILNIAVNARDAMPHGGSLSVIVRQERSEGLGALAPGDYVRISMVDTGVGMDEATRQRAIDPFFTTKPQGKGSGLGLSMVHGLAAQSGGAFVLTSAPGAGTRADIWLPVSMAPRLETSPAPIPSPPQSVRILLVDDEDMVRSGTAEMLRDMGYQVTEASSAAEALEIIRDGASVDCLITDYKMPGMTGAELSLAIRGILPELPIILMTGFAGADVQDLQNIQRLEKPFRQKHLASALQNATGRAAVLS
jgi:signal transduction histidine kinase/CheY-like chemotaxis protein